MKGSCGFIRVCDRFGNYFGLKYLKRQGCWFFTTVLPFITYPESNEFMSLSALIKSRDNYLKIRDEILNSYNTKDFETTQSIFPDYIDSIRSLCRVIGLGNYPPLLQDLAKRSMPRIRPSFSNTSIPFAKSELEEEILSAIDEYDKMSSVTPPTSQSDTEFVTFSSQKDLADKFKASIETVRNNAISELKTIDLYNKYFHKQGKVYSMPKQVYLSVYRSIHGEYPKE